MWLNFQHGGLSQQRVFVVTDRILLLSFFFLALSLLVVFLSYASLFVVFLSYAIIVRRLPLLSRTFFHLFNGLTTLVRYLLSLLK